MPYKCHKELRIRAERFIADLEKGGIAASLGPDAFRDYVVKIDTGSGNIINLYYKPSKKAYSIKLHQVKDESLKAGIEDAWHGDAGKTGKHEYAAYVDGSFINNSVGYGAVILKDGKAVHELCGPVSAEDAGNNRNVAGELHGVLETLGWCESEGIKSIDIFYDYKGIEEWASGRWKTKQEGTRAYAAAVKASPVKVTWHKVAGHSGDRWNEEADRLAKKGAGMGTGTPEPTAQDDPLIAALEAKTAGLIAYLEKWGITARLDSIKNGQFARLTVHDPDTGQRQAIFDLYHTVKKPFSPYIHACKDDALTGTLEGRWREFHHGTLGI